MKEGKQSTGKDIISIGTGGKELGKPRREFKSKLCPYQETQRKKQVAGSGRDSDRCHLRASLLMAFSSHYEGIITLILQVGKLRPR